jgi:UDP-glucose 4-epimerase
MIDYLITGGEGFIGRNLRSYLTSIGKSFVSIDNVNLDKNYTFDVTAELPNTDAKTIVHLASETNVRESIKFPSMTIKRNVAGMINCLELAKRNGQKVIFTSSANSNLPINPYLASKNACEAICKAYKESYSLDVAVLKLSNIYGPHSIHKHSVIPKFIRSCLQRKPLVIYGDGNQRRYFVYVEDVIRSILNGFDAFVAASNSTSISYLAHIIAGISENLTNFKPEIIYKEAISGEILDSPVKTNIMQTVALSTGLTLTFKWYLDNYEY